MKDFGNIVRAMNELMDAHYKLYQKRNKITKELKAMQKVMFIKHSDERLSFVQKVVQNNYIKLTLETYHINMDMYRITYKYKELKKWLKGY